MDSIWDNIDAFTPMFSDVVTYRSGNTATTINAAVFPVDSIEALSEVDPMSDVESIKVFIKKHTIAHDSITPRIGDIVVLTDGRQFKVSKVDGSMNIFDMTARSV